MIGLLLVILQIRFGGSSSKGEIAFVILSQSNDYHAQLAVNLRNNLAKQYEEIRQELPQIYLTHKDFSHVGSWSIFPLLATISINSIPDSRWVIFLEDRSRVHLKKLTEILEKYDYNEKIWLGNELYDNDATIIHHFAFYQNPSFLKYPNIASSFTMSVPMLKSLSQQVKNTSRLPDFSIDNSHELALFIWNEGNGQALINEPSFCIKDAPECSTFVSPYANTESAAMSNKKIFFAVKTCEKFHEDRVPVVKNTWGKIVTNIKYFSNVEDDSVPSINLGIPNTEKGHCAKTLGILKYIDEENEKTGLNISWVVVVDDDTILGVSRLQQLLSRYNHTKDVAVGERYGYNVARPFIHGYNYITGGGGMVFSMPLVKKLITTCKCPTPDSPDDMILGVCMSALNIEITHSSAFHQARPVDYSPKYLQTEEPVSFHKHWMIDPIQVYEEWFAESDALDISLENVHDEL